MITNARAFVALLFMLCEFHMKVQGATSVFFTYILISMSFCHSGYFFSLFFYFLANNHDHDSCDRDDRSWFRPDNHLNGFDNIACIQKKNAALSYSTSFRSLFTPSNKRQIPIYLVQFTQLKGAMSRGFRRF